MAERVYEVPTVDGVPHWPEPAAIERLSEIRAPVLVVVGALDQPDMLRIADLLESRVPRCRKIVLPDTAHLPSMERPAEFNRALLEFLDDLDGLGH
jgi:3-oxoadipate enol-lactonase